MEIEAKYRATERIRPSQVEAVELAPYALGPRQRHPLLDTLLDTADQRLSEQRWTLRLRRDGAQRLLTMKGPAEIVEATHRREEIEMVLERGKSDRPETWPKEIGKRVIQMTDGARLIPLVEIQNNRSTWEVTRGNRVVAEIALDRGEIRVDGASQPLHELEIELKGKGSEEDLVALVARLVARLPLVAEPRSKAHRGLALLAASRVSRYATLEEAAGATPMTADAPLDEAGRSALAGALRRLYDLMPAVRVGSPPEALHEARTLARTIRTLLALLGEESYDEAAVIELRGSLRALTILLSDLDDATAGAADPDAPPAVRAAYEARRDQLRSTLTRQADSKRNRRLLAEVEQFVTSPGRGTRAAPPEPNVPPRQVRHLAGSLLWRRYERVRAYEASYPTASPEALRRLRVEVERFLLVLRFFEPALGERVDRLYATLERALDHLAQIRAALLAEAMAAEVGDDPYRAAQEREINARRPALNRALAPLFGITFRRRLARLLAEM